MYNHTDDSTSMHRGRLGVSVGAVCGRSWTGGVAGGVPGGVANGLFESGRVSSESV